MNASGQRSQLIVEINGLIAKGGRQCLPLFLALADYKSRWVLTMSKSKRFCGPREASSSWYRSWYRLVRMMVCNGKLGCDSWPCIPLSPPFIRTTRPGLQHHHRWIRQPRRHRQLDRDQCRHQSHRRTSFVRNSTLFCLGSTTTRLNSRAMECQCLKIKELIDWVLKIGAKRIPIKCGR